MDDDGKLIHFTPLRVLFFGMTGLLSRIPLAKLLEANINVCGVVLPTSVLPPYLHPANGRLQTHTPQDNNSLLLSPYPDILQLAAQYQIPVTAVTHLRHPDSLSEIKSYQPDLICVSCFDQIFPKSLLIIPRYGCLNLHPSLLPKFRGPSPLFWTFQRGVQETGATIHIMDKKLDSGAIVLQAKQQLRDGISGNEAEILLADLGAELFIKTIAHLQEGELQTTPQSGKPSYYSIPTESDFELKGEWSARRAFNFMRGTAEWQRPYFVNMDSEKVWLKTAVSFSLGQRQAHLIQRQHNQLSIQFGDGILIATQ